MHRFILAFLGFFIIPLLANVADLAFKSGTAFEESASAYQQKTAKRFPRKVKKEIKAIKARAAKTGHPAVSKRFGQPYQTKSAYDRPEVEVRSNQAVLSKNVVKDWNNFLGARQTDINPHLGTRDPDRIWSANGKRSVRYGGHEMNSAPNKQHYHKETWFANEVHNEVQRVQKQ